MSNNTQMVSVPRELLERVTRDPMGVSARKGHWGSVCELAELLAAPAEDVRAVVDEPVAWLDTESGALATAELKAFLDSGFETPLYRHPQRPVVLPGRKPASYKTSVGLIPYHEGWNACLDAVEEMNK